MYEDKVIFIYIRNFKFSLSVFGGIFVCLFSLWNEKKIWLKVCFRVLFFVNKLYYFIEK